MGSGLTGKLGRAWLVHGCMVVVGDVVGVGLLHVYTTWIGDVGLGVGFQVCYSNGDLNSGQFVHYFLSR